MTTAPDDRAPPGPVPATTSWLPRGRGKRVACLLTAFFFTAMGVLHFVAPEPFVRAIPPWLPSPLALVYVSGVAEIAGGLGVLHPRLRVAAAWGLVALLVAVFPANIHMALHPEVVGGEVPSWALWARLPLQAPMIAVAWWLTRPDVTRA